MCQGQSSKVRLWQRSSKSTSNAKGGCERQVTLNVLLILS